MMSRHALLTHFFLLKICLFVWPIPTCSMPSPDCSKTQAIVCRSPSGGNREWALEQVAIAPAADDEAIVELVASGICHTDLICGSLPDEALSLGLPRYPRVLGHEGLFLPPSNS